MMRQVMLRYMTILSWICVASGAVLPHTLFGAADLSGRLHTRADDRTILTDPDTGRTFVPGESSTDRTVYNSVALFCTITLAVFLGMSDTVGLIVEMSWERECTNHVPGFRLKTLRNNVIRKRNFTSMLIVALFIFGLGFIICASVVQTGQGLRTHQLCYSAAMICLVFYTGNKLTMYVQR